MTNSCGVRAHTCHILDQLCNIHCIWRRPPRALLLPDPPAACPTHPHPLQLLTPIVERVLQRDMQRFAEYAAQHMANSKA